MGYEGTVNHHSYTPQLRRNAVEVSADILFIAKEAGRLLNRSLKEIT